MTENSDASSKNLKSEFRRVYFISTLACELKNVVLNANVNVHHTQY